MKKLLSFYLIFLSWIFSMTAVFFFPAQIETPSEESSIYTSFEIQEQAQISAGIELTEVPNFKIDQKLFGNFIEDLKIDFYGVANHNTDRFLSIKGTPLFDVKKLFIHFFHPW